MNVWNDFKLVYFGLLRQKKKKEGKKIPNIFERVF